MRAAGAIGGLSKRHFAFMGHITGDHGAQQSAVLSKLFEALYTHDTPGTISDVGWRWERETYPPTS